MSHRLACADRVCSATAGVPIELWADDRCCSIRRSKGVPQMLGGVLIR